MTSSCNSKITDTDSMPKGVYSRPSLVGNEYDQLTVQSLAGVDEHGNYVWNCLCKCGEKCKVRGYNLKSRMTKSCGCLRVKTSSELMKKLNAKRWKSHDTI